MGPKHECHDLELWFGDASFFSLMAIERRTFSANNPCLRDMSDLGVHTTAGAADVRVCAGVCDSRTWVFVHILTSSCDCMSPPFHPSLFCHIHTCRTGSRFGASFCVRRRKLERDALHATCHCPATQLGLGTRSDRSRTTFRFWLPMGKCTPPGWQ